MAFVKFGDLRRLHPISREFGFDRGLPVDRYYIEKFLTQYAADVRGRVLEIGGDSYTRRFGGSGVEIRDVLHVDGGNPLATIVGDLADADHLPSDAFDCFIMTQTLHLIFDTPTAIQTVSRILKPGGVLLATFPGVSQISIDQWSEKWCWSLTSHSAARLFADVFPPEQTEIRVYGNALAITSFLHGVAVEELTPEELDRHEPGYELILTVRAVKPEHAPAD